MSTARCQENHDHRITSWNGPQPMATFPPTEEEEEEGKEEVIRAKRLINSHAFRKLFPSPFVHPFRNLFATSIPLRDIAVCKYHVLHPFFFSPFDPVSFNPSFLSPRQPRECIPPTYSVSSFESRNWVADLAPRERERKRDNYRVSWKNMQIRMPIRDLVMIVIFHRAYLDRF